MGRPSCITPEIAALIDAAVMPGRSAELVHRRVVDTGGSVSLSTVRRYMARAKGGAVSPAHMAAEPVYARPAVAKLAQAALEGDDLAELHAAKAAVSAALKGWEGSLGFDPRGVRAYSALVALLKSVTQAIQELTPRTVEDRYEPIEGAALAELRGRFEAVAKLDDDLRARLRRQQEVIEDLIDRSPE
jgi:hypothetical protein